MLATVSAAIWSIILQADNAAGNTWDLLAMWKRMTWLPKGIIILLFLLCVVIRGDD